jgi:hypothetical protein
LEIHRKELEEESAATQSAFDMGDRVGEISQSLYDPRGKGVFFDRYTGSFESVFTETQDYLSSNVPLFEAGFRGNGALAFADVLLPVGRGAKKTWRMVEVKSNASVKPIHKEDVAIQVFVARAAGLKLQSVSLAHVDTDWVYPGGEEYTGLLKEVDLTDEAMAMQEDVSAWVANAQTVAAKRTEPKAAMGTQCNKPYACAFQAYCAGKGPAQKFPVDVLPGHKSRALKALVEDQGVSDLREIPDEVLNARQLRVKKHTILGKRYFDKKGAAEALSACGMPLLFLDFEAINPAVPLWKGTSPYQVIPFQFSAHRVDRNGNLTHQEFLDLSGKDPSRKLAQALIDACGARGTIFAYSPFEKTVIKDLVRRFPKEAAALQSIESRLVDLLPIVQDHYYDPAQCGSWSIKAVLPTISKDLRYSDLEGVQDGVLAMQAYQEAIHTATTASRKVDLRRMLLNYCKTDTLAMVRLWQFLIGRSDLKE